LELLDRLRALPSVLFAAWFSLLLVAYHIGIPPGTIPSHAITLLFAGLILAGAAGIGTHLLRLILPAADDGLLGSLLALGVGLGAVEVALLALLAAGATSAWTGWLVLAAGAVAAGRCASLWRGRFSTARECWREIARRRWAPPLLALALLAWLGALGAALAPAEFYDALIYHLAVPARYIASGGVGMIEGNYYARFPGGQGMLYALAILLRPDPIAAGSLAQLLHLATGAAAALATFEMGRRHLRLGSGLLGAALFATTPGVLLIAIYPIADLAAAFYGSLVLACLLEARAGEGGRRGWTRLAGLLAGLALGVKYTAAISVVAPAMIWLAWEARRLDRRRLADLALFALIAAAVFSPWMARNALLEGNPVAPYMASLFGGGKGPGLADELARRLPEDGGAAVAAHILSGPWRAGIERLGAGGYLGVAFILLIPFLLLGGTGGRQGPIQLIAVVGFTALAGWAATVQVTRYLFPALPAFALMAAEGAARLAGSGRLARSLLAACTGWLILHHVYLFGVLAFTINPFGVALGVEMPEDYLNRRVSYYPAASFINGSLPRDARVLLVGEGRTYYLEREVLANTPFDEKEVLRLAARAAARGDDLAAFLRAEGITHLLVSGPEMTRIARTAGAESYLSEAVPETREAVTRLLGGAGTHLLYERAGVRVLELVPD